jgi:hypothetical protein
MMPIRTCLGWGVSVAVILLGPIVVIFGIPLAAGIGLDVFDVAGGRPIALALCAPLAFILLHRAVTRVLAHRLAATLVGRASRSVLRPS